jgi:hypothetical protein
MKEAPMPHVTLAYAHGDHAAGETIEVSEDEAVGLVRDGLAQRAGEPAAVEMDEGADEVAPTTPADDEEA